MSQSADGRFARGTVFRELHSCGDTFVIPNPWNAGSARILEHLGFRALTTTSGGLAASLGLQDGGMSLVSRDETLANAAEIAAATSLPVATDLENCYADTPAGVADTIRLAAETGVVGGSIEDASGDSREPIYPHEVAVERVAAAVAAVRELPFPFTLTARAENFLHGNPDLDNTINRLRRYSEAGADVLFAPLLPDLDAVRKVCSSVDKPVNVLVSNPEWTVEKLRAAGVTRISLGSALSNAAFGAALAGAREVHEAGTFTFADNPDIWKINDLMSPRR